jgi:peroxiredoxin
LHNRVRGAGKPRPLGGITTFKGASHMRTILVSFFGLLLLATASPSTAGTVTGTIQFANGRLASRGMVYVQHWSYRKNIDSTQIERDGQFSLTIRGGCLYNLSIVAEGVPGWIQLLYLVDNSQIRIVVQQPDDECQVIFSEPASYAARVNTAGKELLGYISKLREHQTQDTFWRDSPRILDSLTSNQVDSISIYRYLLSRLCTIAFMRNATSADSSAIRGLLARIPPSTPLWIYVNSILFAPLDYVNVIDYADKVIQSLPDAESQNWFRFVYLPRGVARADSARVWAYATAVQKGSNPELAAMARPFLPRRSTDTTPGLRMTSIKPGMAMPEFVFNRFSGKTLTLSSVALKHRPYLLSIWATWCGPCIRQMPYLDTAWTKFHSLGLEVVTVSVDADLNALRKYWKSAKGKEWSNLFASDGLNNPYIKAMGVYSVPREFLVDGRGTLVAVDRELIGPQLSKTLSQFFAR